MGFQTPLYELSDYLKWTTEGKIQLPDFQRGYKWEDERIRQLLVTIVRGHPLGVVMLLKSGNDQIRFKPRPVEGVTLSNGVEAESLLLDGQQRLTSLTQALTGTGVVATKDSRGKLMERRYYIDIALALQGDDRIDEALVSVPGDGVVRTNFGKDVTLDVSTPELERDAGYFPTRLLFGGAETVNWLFALKDHDAGAFHEKIIGPASTYNIPAIELDKSTSKSAVATVFEKVNTGGLPLNVFELLTAVFAGDKSYFDAHGEDFRLNDDWTRTRELLAAHPVLKAVESTDFLQAVCLLATLKRANAHTGDGKAPAVSARREDVLTLSLADYLEWVEPLREAFDWAASFLADHYIFDARFLPYAKQLVPLAAIRVVLGADADLHGAKQRLGRWFWCGILGELYGGTIETRFARDLEQVPGWLRDESAPVPRTVQDFGFRTSRLLSLRTRNAAAYKGIYALVLAQGARDWMYDQGFDKVQYVTLAVDIHHIFPHKWCLDHDVDPVLRESIVNKTPLAAATNRAIGGAAPSKYLGVIENKAGIGSPELDALLDSHAINADALRNDDFDAHFATRLAELVVMIENASGKQVQDDLSDEEPEESPEQFDPADEAVIPDIDDQESE